MNRSETTEYCGVNVDQFNIFKSQNLKNLFRFFFVFFLSKLNLSDFLAISNSTNCKNVQIEKLPGITKNQKGKKYLKITTKTSGNSPKFFQITTELKSCITFCIGYYRTVFQIDRAVLTLRNLFSGSFYRNYYDKVLISNYFIANSNRTVTKKYYISPYIERIYLLKWTAY